MASILALLTGGTIGLRASTDGATGEPCMERADVAREVLLPAAAATLGEAGTVECEAVATASGAELTLRTIFATRDRILAERDRRTGFLVTTGTDALEEFAFALDLLLPPGVAVAVTGSAKPLHVDGYDGRANCIDALRVLTSSELRPWSLGVVVVFNDAVHAARHVRKADSALVGMFASHPGPLAQIRSGRVHCYFPSLPAQDRMLDARWTGDGASAPRVGLWVVVVDGPLPPDSYLETLDGLVVAGMGTGSLPAALADVLARHVAERGLAVVVASRVPVGLNHDDAYYRGSVAKYERRGFLVRGGYEALNMYQARLKLVLHILCTKRRAAAGTALVQN